MQQVRDGGDLGGSGVPRVVGFWRAPLGLAPLGGGGGEKRGEVSAGKYLVFCPTPVDPCFPLLACACLLACGPPGVDRRGHSSHGGGVPHPDRHGRQAACASG